MIEGTVNAGQFRRSACGGGYKHIHQFPNTMHEKQQAVDRVEWITYSLVGSCWLSQMCRRECIQPLTTQDRWRSPMSPTVL